MGGGGGGEVPPATCPPIAGQTAFFRGTDYELSPAVYGAVTPTSSCDAITCAAGTVMYYPDSTILMPHTTEPLEAAGSLKATDCVGGTMCFCLESGECFQSTSADSITLIPSDGKMYLFVSDPDAEFTGDMNTLLTFENFYGDVDPKPFTESNLPVKSVSCTACPAVSTC